MDLGLRDFMKPDVFRPDAWVVELGMGSVGVICAVLLGVSASNVGSQVVEGCRLCYVHTPALSGQTNQSAGSFFRTLQ